MNTQISNIKLAHELNKYIKNFESHKENQEYMIITIIKNLNGLS